MKKKRNRQIDLSKVAGGTDNPKTETYSFDDSINFVDENGTTYLGNVKGTTTTTSYNTSETTIKKGGPLSDLIKKINRS